MPQKLSLARHSDQVPAPTLKELWRWDRCRWRCYVTTQGDRSGQVSSRKSREWCSRCPEHVGPCDWEGRGGAPSRVGHLQWVLPCGRGNSWGGGPQGAWAQSCRHGAGVRTKVRSHVLAPQPQMASFLVSILPSLVPFTPSPYAVIHRQDAWNVFIKHKSKYACILSRFSCVRWPYGLWPTRLLYPWDSPGKNTGLGCPPPGDLPNPGIKSESFRSALAECHLGSPMHSCTENPPVT